VCEESQIRSKIRTAQAPETGQAEPKTGGRLREPKEKTFTAMYSHFLVCGHDELCALAAALSVGCALPCFDFGFETPREMVRLAGRFTNNL
jgi:hypothetical protein